MGSVMARFWVLFALVAASLVLAGGAFPSPKTTTPGAQIVIGVILSDQSVNVFDGARAPRGATVIFLISNRGKKRHNFQVFGKRTVLLKPKQSAKMVVNVLARGAFPYQSTVDKGPRFRGHFVIY
ncbi:MAG: hypothetical protein QOE43_2274 [Gaiellaceae bacterium]|jgi:hypothetical protein|nr:hypothetical protein [Gaiellaceae bacterium]